VGSVRVRSIPWGIVVVCLLDSWAMIWTSLVRFSLLLVVLVVSSVVVESVVAVVVSDVKVDAVIWRMTELKLIQSLLAVSKVDKESFLDIVTLIVDAYVAARATNDENANLTSSVVSLVPLVGAISTIRRSFGTRDTSSACSSSS